MSYSDDNNVASSRDADQFISSTPVFFGIPSMLQSVAALDLLPTSRTKVMEQSPLISENSGYETIQIYR